MKAYLNLGCGSRFHSNWTNVDIVSYNENVLAHNLREGIPFSNEYFKVVYHSHVLEHFSKVEGEKFIEECFRVLESSGVIRIAVPDLERIARLYIESLERAIEGDKQAKDNYEWIMLELYDQTVRNHSGGEMKKYLGQEILTNEKFIYKRIGSEGKNLRNTLLKVQPSSSKIKPRSTKQPVTVNQGKSRIGLIQKIREKIFYTFYKKEASSLHELKMELNTHKEALAIGKFRLGGEVHQWMYDRYSLKEILEKVGFTKVEIKSAFESDIPNWQSFELDAKDDTIFKPDSLFMEGIKP